MKTIIEQVLGNKRNVLARIKSQNSNGKMSRFFMRATGCPFDVAKYSVMQHAIIHTNYKPADANEANLGIKKAKEYFNIV